MTPEQRIRRARLGGLTRAAVMSDEERSASAARAQGGLLTKFERQIDPDGTMPVAERARRAEALRRAHMIRLAEASAKARKARKTRGAA